MPKFARNELASAPAATRAAVSRALDRSATSRASFVPNFMAPARSAWPGRGRVMGFRSSVFCTRFMIWSVTMAPSEWPLRMPVTISASSFSSFIRAPRP
jgi:hypothetical protein